MTEKKNLRILHLASFEGNIGDNANHVGTRKLLRQNLSSFNLDFTELEIREFFWKNRKYDETFSKHVNSFDLLIFGGGNFFELWVEDSCNGTSVDISIDVLKLIHIPVVFYSLGMDPAQGVTKARLDRFKNWLDYVFSKPNQFIVSVRNDGAMETAKKHLGEHYSNKIHWVPDGGFFTEIRSQNHIEIEANKKVIGINLAGDMLDIRFPNKPGFITYEEFLSTLGRVFDEKLAKDQDLHLVFFPHIYKDLRIISDFLSHMLDSNCRKRVTVAPYLHGYDAQNYIFDAYRKCDIIMGNRFHTNVCAIGLGIPTIGFINYPQIEKLYSELGLQNRTIQVNKVGFGSHLAKLIDYTFKNSESIKLNYVEKVNELEKHINKFHKNLNDWLEKKEIL